MNLRAFLSFTAIVCSLAPIACPLLSLAQGQPGGQGAMSGMSQDERRARFQKFLQNRRGGRGAQAGSEATGALGHGSGRSAGRAGIVPVDSSRVNLKSDLAYGKDPLQKIDVYMPKDPPAKPMPILIFFHGGGWRRGDKAMGDHGEKGNNYTAQNIIFVSGNYRLAPAVVHPKEVEDVAAAVAYVKEHAAEFGGDPDRIYVMGHSAGAHLVDLLGTNERFLAGKGLSFKDIKGVISLDTASLNLSERKEDKSAEIGMVGPMIDTAFGTDPKVLADASPTLQIHPGKKYPPFLMFCGERRLSCVVQHNKFEKAMKAAGGTVTVTPVPLNHGEINRAAGQSDSDIFKAVVAMIEDAK